MQGTYCVRWSPCGKLLATASNKSTVNLIDFGSGKSFYTGITSDGSKSFYFAFFNYFFGHKIGSATSVCFI